ncbi:MAG: NAD(P)-dependent glycerol-3-phosphate dehydrogenase [Acidobacteria bacterium]|jgi:glycerol-3-phosphate dehydrogenase (NAD(P)+)|nr:NAD(P)-dependent glycerol-3-phosphate dehydrogenase [Acidobacteriota bacterium]
MSSILVIGGGSWGTAFADYLARQEEGVRLWVREDEVLATIRSHRENRVFLPGIELAPGLEATAALEQAAAAAAVLVLAVPSKFIRSVLRRLAAVRREDHVLVNLSKGFESDSLMTISQVAAEVFGPGVARQWLTLSGPSFARELAGGHPTAVVAASENGEMLERLQARFSSATLRVYRSGDLRGLEVAGALKNVMAIASGMISGLGYGFNTTASLVTRANMEISRLGLRLGARAETFWGLGGIGDLMLTCFGTLSRNFQLGRRIALGESLAAVERSTPMVAEGVETTKAVQQLAEQLAIEMPIAREVHRVLFDGKDARSAVHDLMLRSLKNEWNIN